MNFRSFHFCRAVLSTLFFFRRLVSPLLMKIPQIFLRIREKDFKTIILTMTLHTRDVWFAGCERSRFVSLQDVKSKVGRVAF
jgi:hypothetical protein